MLVKRIGVMLGSLIVGIILTELMLVLVGTNREIYGFIYYFFTALSLGIAIAVWADKFADTKLLPE
jgi:uncharacterized integral membrane protein